MVQLLFIDNFDSFSYILIDYLKSSGAEITVITNESDPGKIKVGLYDGIVISPGPATPGEAGYLMQYLKLFADKLPVLGVCLGHQAIGMYFGLQLEKALIPMHGKTSPVYHQNNDLFQQISNPFQACRYHSLVLKGNVPELEILAQTSEGEIMAIKHKSLPVYGVQFHPEALLTESGLQLIKNWVGMVNV
jgi:anthranilate synthase component 2